MTSQSMPYRFLKERDDRAEQGRQPPTGEYQAETTTYIREVLYLEPLAGGNSTVPSPPPWSLDAVNPCTVFCISTHSLSRGWTSLSATS